MSPWTFRDFFDAGFGTKTGRQAGSANQKRKPSNFRRATGNTSSVPLFSAPLVRVFTSQRLEATAAIARDRER
jgi:hypothetical protein